MKAEVPADSFHVGEWLASSDGRERRAKLRAIFDLAVKGSFASEHRIYSLIEQLHREREIMGAALETIRMTGMLMAKLLDQESWDMAYNLDAELREEPWTAEGHPVVEEGSRIGYPSTRGFDGAG